MIDILEKININKRMEIEELKIELPLESIKDRLPDKGKFRLTEALSSDSLNIIAEIKKGSPSKGIISEDFHPDELARQYKDGGAKALSVLTERKFFFGDYKYLKMTSDVSGLPVLCKDFILDKYQIYHAKYLYADAVLLIVRMLSDDNLNKFIDTARLIGIDTLVETHTVEEVKRAVAAGAEIIGVNNRDLATFDVSLDRCIELAEYIPDDKIKVAESGIFNRTDIDYLRRAGFNNFLIGEALVKANNPAELLREMTVDE